MIAVVRGARRGGLLPNKTKEVNLVIFYFSVGF